MSDSVIDTTPSVAAEQQNGKYGVFLLREANKQEFLNHLLKLDAPARRCRFGGPVSDSHIHKFVERFSLQSTFGLYVWGALEGTVSVAAYPGGNHGELAISLLPSLRGRGWGKKLVKHALLSAYMQGMARVDIQYLSSNEAMRKIAGSLPGYRESSAGETCLTVDLEAWFNSQGIGFLSPGTL